VNRAKNDIFIALMRIGVGPGVNMESHNDVATEVMMLKTNFGNFPNKATSRVGWGK
jgi:hypothetical protein